MQGNEIFKKKKNLRIVFFSRVELLKKFVASILFSSIVKIYEV